MTPEPSLPTSLALFLTYRSVWLMGWMSVLMIFENRFPLRQMKRTDRAQAWIRNIGLGAITEVTQRWVAAPLLGAIVSAALLHAPFLSTTLDELIPAKMPIAGAGVMSLVLLDGVLYAWHRMNHRIPVLWRFHRVHHSDPAMDASTSIRFHPGEFLLATAASALQWTLVGGRLDLYLFYDVAVLVAVPFHHANLRLPGKLDALLQKLFITPEIHGIHHSVRPEETDSNFGTVFSFWDRILGTARMRAPASEIQVGLRPPLREKLIALLLSPFRL